MTRTQIGAWGSIVYLCVLGALTEGRWDQLRTMELNEVGDFLAGASSPLAFLWLVLGYLQQGDELQASRRTLQLQADELQRSVEQQSLMVAVARDEHAANLRAMQFQEEQAQAQRAAAIEAARPRLLLAKGGRSTSQGRCTWDLQISNAGRECSGIKVHLATDTNYASITGARERTHLPRGAEFQIAITSEPPTDWTGTLIVDFVDVNGVSGSVQFHVSAIGREIVLPTDRK